MNEFYVEYKKYYNQNILINTLRIELLIQKYIKVLKIKFKKEN